MTTDQTMELLALLQRIAKALEKQTAASEAQTRMLVNISAAIQDAAGCLA